jgi:hypothetical protein
MARRLLRLAAVLAFLGLGAWVGLVLWANTASARRLALGMAGKQWRGAIELKEMRVGWGLDVTLVGLKVADLAGQPFLDLPVVEAGWRLPLGDQPPLWVRLPGGRLELHAESWGLHFPPRQPQLPYLVPEVPGLPQGALATAGTWKVPPEPLVQLEVDGVTGLFAAPRVAVELPFTLRVVRADLHTGGRLEVHRAEIRLADVTSLHANGKLTPRHAEVKVNLPSTGVAELTALPPFPVLLVPLGLAAQGAVEAEVTLGTSMGRVSKAEGAVHFRDLAVKMGPEELLREGVGSWKFQREGAGIAGKLELGTLAFRMTGLPIRLQKTRGRLELGPGLVRVARLEGEGPLGPVRGSYRFDLRQGFDWTLDLEVGGAPGAWLSGATVLAGPAGIRLEGVSLRGPGLDVILEAGVLPEGLDPPTWRLDEAAVFGTVPDGPIQLRDLGGVLYLDSEGGHSFFLESDAGKFQGQVTADGALKLWVKRSVAAEMKYLDLPARGS